MKRLLLAAALAVSLVAGGLEPPPAVGGPDAALAKKCKKKNKKKCKKKKSKPKAKGAFKDGKYTYVNTQAAGISGTSVVKISGEGTKISVTETFFSSESDIADTQCDTTTISFGTQTLEKDPSIKGNLVWESTSDPEPVPPIAEDGPGGGTAETLGSVNPKTLEIQITNTVRMKSRSGGTGCYEGHDYFGKLKRAG